jgi:pilus assembly protein FimV
MTTMPQASRFVVFLGVGSALLSSTPLVSALGMGNALNHTLLGSPLDVSIPVMGGGDERNPPPSDCIKAEVVAGDSTLPSRMVSTRLEPGRGDALYRVRVSTQVNMTEPVVTVALSLGCDSPLTKRFVLFVDPPGLAQGTPLAMGEGAPTGVPAAVRSTGPDSVALPSSSPARPRARAPAPAAATPAAADQPVRDATRVRSAPAKAASAPRSTGPRLSLEAPTVVATVPAPAASEPSPDEVALANQLALLTQLEDMLKQVSAENKSVQASVSGLQAKLRDAEQALQKERERQREQPPIVWVLGGLVGLLGLVLLVLLLSRPRRRKLPFFENSSFGEAPKPGLPEPPVLDSMPSQLQEPAVLSQLDSVPMDMPAEPVAAPKAREVAVEELIDLEQQADFFIALGQDQAAIDLLTSHMNGASSTSPLPYLKLIDLYRRRGDRMAYEQTRLRFHRRFNARIPDWNAPQSPGRGLDDYPEVQRAVQTNWSSPGSAMKLLEGFLFRREGQGTTFDLTAYRDLLMLYAVARDLAAQEGNSPSVDLELPMDL